MPRSATLLIPPAGAGADGSQPASGLATQCPEDLRLAERVQRALCATGYGQLRGLEVTARARHVILSGRVPTYFLKQLAQATALAVPGSRQVTNNLAVGRPR